MVGGLRTNYYRARLCNADDFHHRRALRKAKAFAECQVAPHKIDRQILDNDTTAGASESSRSVKIAPSKTAFPPRQSTSARQNCNARFTTLVRR